MAKTNPPRPAQFSVGPPGYHKPFHHVTVFFISEQEKTAFLKAGVEFTEVAQGPRGESVTFDIGEEDARWQDVTVLIASLEGNDQVSKKFRVQDISMAMPTLKESVQSSVRSFLKRGQTEGQGWLDGYSGQTAVELLSLEGKYRTDSLVLAFEAAIRQKANREGAAALTHEEQVVLAVEALEREVNNGGYEQFFTNSSREFTAMIVDSLERIGCTRTAKLTRKAIGALGISDLSVKAVDDAMAIENKYRRQRLRACDDSYYKNAEPIAERLFAFVKANQDRIRI